MKARKMAAGTWTAEKPSKTKGTTERVDKADRPKTSVEKRPRSESKTPPRPTGSYSDTVSGIRRAVINRRHPDTVLTQEQSDLQYIKKPSARERPTLCPICFQDVITHFTRHLFRHHEKNENVKTIQKLKPGSKQRLALVAALRKQGYFHLKTEKDILNPVRTSTNPETEYFVCIYCLGHYNKKLLYKHTYINDLGENAYKKLNNEHNEYKDIRINYKILTECVLAHTVMFNRKRIGDVQYLKVETYTKASSAVDQEAFIASLTPTEKILSKQFKRIVTGGKGSKPVPILFSKRIQKFISCLLNIREITNIVPKCNSYLFANPGSDNKWMSGTNVIRRLAKDCGAKQPALLTSTKFRKHIATTLQLMSMQPDEMEQIATFMGHTKKTHAEFYRLPQDIFQTAEVAKVLLLLEKGKGKEFRGKSLSEIELGRDAYYSSESDEDDTLSSIRPALEDALNPTTSTENESLQQEDIRNNKEFEKVIEHLEEGIEGNFSAIQPADISTEDEEAGKSVTTKAIIKKGPDSKNVSGRIRWTIQEKQCVLKYFQLHLKKKVTPKKHECIQFIEKHGKNLINKDWVRIKTLVYNSFRSK
ncbi:hypothetical protein MML48_5g00016181 [Holotrichia oblita]|uniref:Uncharacterized protein n=1 Tax=Holotrichia oblita TaxID=644536 RepID=A0ACB9T397_HOLOL|nr:hypothetical protein MML48_5g00016181 [Holotrichia oblita]